MPVDVGTIAPVGLISLALGYAGQSGMAWIKSRGDRAEKKIEAGVTLARHSDNLMVEVVSLARGEVSAARQEMALLREQVDRLRPLETNFYELEQALEHLDAILTAAPANRAVAERSAKAFLNRMRRTAEARGTVVNEAQRILSGINVAEDKVVKKKD